MSIKHRLNTSHLGDGCIWEGLSFMSPWWKSQSVSALSSFKCSDGMFKEKRNNISFKKDTGKIVL